MCSGIDSLAEYRILQSRSGQPTAMHIPSGCLIHSRIDPVREAQTIAGQYPVCAGDAVVLLGGGLGYLAEALFKMTGKQGDIWVIEPEMALIRLSHHNRPEGVYTALNRIHLLSAATIGSLTKDLKHSTMISHLIVSPYFLQIAGLQSGPLSDYVRVLRAEIASRSVYNSLILEHERKNADSLLQLKSIHNVMLPSEKLTIVCGAGPSLSQVADSIQTHRDHLTVIAASGAVPSLRKRGIIPDWVVALEAKEAVVRDLTALPDDVNLIVFPATHPEIFTRFKTVRLYRATDTSGGSLTTRGGSSLIPALDFALKQTTGDVALVGADLGYQNGRYAEGALRETEYYDSVKTPPKFASMRAGLETLLAETNRNNRVIFHVLDSGNTLRGSQQVTPDQFTDDLLKMQHQRYCHV